MPTPHLGLMFMFSKKPAPGPPSIKKPTLFQMTSMTRGTAGMNMTTNSMMSIIRAPPGSCSSCGH